MSAYVTISIQRHVKPLPLVVLTIRKKLSIIDEKNIPRFVNHKNVKIFFIYILSLYIYTYIYTRVYMCIYIYSHTHTYIYRYTHTHNIYTYIDVY